MECSILAALPDLADAVALPLTDRPPVIESGPVTENGLFTRVNPMLAALPDLADAVALPLTDRPAVTETINGPVADSLPVADILPVTNLPVSENRGPSTSEAVANSRWLPINGPVADSLPVADTPSVTSLHVTDNLPVTESEAERSSGEFVAVTQLVLVCTLRARAVSSQDSNGCGGEGGGGEGGGDGGGGDGGGGEGGGGEGGGGDGGGGLGGGADGGGGDGGGGDGGGGLDGAMPTPPSYSHPPATADTSHSGTPPALRSHRAATQSVRENPINAAGGGIVSPHAFSAPSGISPHHASAPSGITSVVGGGYFEGGGEGGDGGGGGGGGVGGGKRAGNCPQLLAGNGPRLLAGNGSRLLAGNGLQLLAGNCSRLLAGNGPRLLAGNGPQLLAGNGLRLLAAETARMRPVLRSAAERSLPAPLRPTLWLVVSSLPRLASGKVRCVYSYYLYIDLDIYLDLGLACGRRFGWWCRRCRAWSRAR